MLARSIFPVMAITVLLSIHGQSLATLGPPTFAGLKAKSYVLQAITAIT